MSDHKRQIATLRVRLNQENGRLEAMYADAYSMLPPASGLMLAPHHPGHAPVLAGSPARGGSSRRAASPSRQEPRQEERPGRPPVSARGAEREQQQGRSRSRLTESSPEPSQHGGRAPQQEADFSVPTASPRQMQGQMSQWGGAEGRNGGPPNPAQFKKK